MYSPQSRGCTWMSPAETFSSLWLKRVSSNGHTGFLPGLSTALRLTFGFRTPLRLKKSRNLISVCFPRWLCSWTEGGFSQASLTQDPDGLTRPDPGPVSQAAITQASAAERTFGNIQHQPGPHHQHLTRLKAHHPDQTRVG